MAFLTTRTMRPATAAILSSNRRPVNVLEGLKRRIGARVALVDRLALRREIARLLVYCARPLAVLNHLVEYISLALIGTSVAATADVACAPAPPPSRQLRDCTRT